MSETNSNNFQTKKEKNQELDYFVLIFFGQIFLMFVKEILEPFINVYIIYFFYCLIIFNLVYFLPGKSEFVRKFWVNKNLLQRNLYLIPLVAIFLLIAHYLSKLILLIAKPILKGMSSEISVLLVVGVLVLIASIGIYFVEKHGK